MASRTSTSDLDKQLNAALSKLNKLYGLKPISRQTEMGSARNVSTGKTIKEPVVISSGKAFVLDYFFEKRALKYAEFTNKIPRTITLTKPLTKAQLVAFIESLIVVKKNAKNMGFFDKLN